ncbi:MAG: phosphoadenosine phosphosulfate reductase [Bacteroidetes bacterium GWC2_33_15]|nr:MAG: phosphoadenosine phosphosulfate reductase [Bacteroidetes bacterium GWA2_33_15]OFX48689.1 MAG: phosphoadenosine phosphosulfate reductase [Bacteroidetes bacterium GWC2_33_15]OFX65078.1 MAG: phosphoadenosine phosphosulfate reductase [Bacteroidetes bacterium GWB2_32_14]OFX69164.1 MAG: phosphoadenosine phosphosulfate reductase [Bacteroidetes bacterium GWD2_33_33]HAN17510.1 phosphoadenylyl-sulfate reductase [Bacteroidales bacterium]
MKSKNLVQELNTKLSGLTPEDVLKYFLIEYKGKIALSSSLGAEDQVLTHMICDIDKNTKIFTLDTGRMFPETYKLIEKTNTRYKIKINIFFPDYKQVEEMVNEKGINLFYESVENRKMCCHIRKIEPLKRAFKDLDVWICGLRKDQSITRISNQLIEWDEQNGLIKINPLIDWSEQQVWDYIRKNNIPYNDLHDKGFPSIGCQPCTRAILPGEDVRAGRWWWEQPDKKECGLHNRGE